MSADRHILRSAKLSLVEFSPESDPLRGCLRRLAVSLAALLLLQIAAGPAHVLAAHISEISPSTRTVSVGNGSPETFDYPAHIEITLGDTQAQTLQLVIADARNGSRSGTVLQVITFDTSAADLDPARTMLLADSSGPAIPEAIAPDAAATFGNAVEISGGFAIDMSLPRTLLLFSGSTGWDPASFSRIATTSPGSALLLDAITFGPQGGTKAFSGLSDGTGTEFGGVLIFTEAGDVIATPHIPGSAASFSAPTATYTHLAGPVDAANLLFDEQAGLLLGLNPGQANLAAMTASSDSSDNDPHMPEPHSLAILLASGAILVHRRHLSNAK